MIADLAARLSRPRPDAIDDAVRESLRLLADALRLDHAVLWRDRRRRRAPSRLAWAAARGAARP